MIGTRLYGKQVIVDKHLQDTMKWQFPQDRFVEWGPEDESYCRFAGYGKEAVAAYAAFDVAGILYVSPGCLAMLQKHIPSAPFCPVISTFGCI